MIWSAVLLMTADLATRDIAPSRNFEFAVMAVVRDRECDRAGRYRHLAGVATTLREPSAQSETLLHRYAPRAHFVTRAIVERTVAGRGVGAVLTERERAWLGALPHECRRADWLGGRIAAKRAVRAVCRQAGARVPPYRAIDVGNDADGAPDFRVAGRDDLSQRFNLSIAHTEGAAIAALAETATSGTVGVDIESAKPLPLALLARVLTPTEMARLGAASGHPSPLDMWTAKEAALKAAHRFCGALRDIELSWDEPRAIRARVVREFVPAHRIIVRHESFGRFTVALALCR
jgi:4'-phosphopantetheinyl transferase EntD